MKCPIHISKQSILKKEAQSLQALNLAPKQGSRLRMKSQPQSGHPLPPYRFVRGTADGGGVAAGLCHLQARVEVIVKHQLPIPDGQAQELSLWEAGWMLNIRAQHWQKQILQLMPQPVTDSNEGPMCEQQPCVGGNGKVQGSTH